MSVRNMNIYLQELSSTTFLSRLSVEYRTAVAELYDSSPWILEHAVRMIRGAWPRESWAEPWSWSESEWEEWKIRSLTKAV